MTPSQLAIIKSQVEQSAVDQGQSLPDGFTITFSEDTKLIKVFLNEDSYHNLSEPSDVIVSKWVNGKWEDA